MCKSNSEQSMSKGSKSRPHRELRAEHQGVTGRTARTASECAQITRQRQIESSVIGDELGKVVESEIRGGVPAPVQGSLAVVESTASEVVHGVGIPAKDLNSIGRLCPTANSNTGNNA